MSAVHKTVKKLQGDEVVLTRAATARNGELKVETIPSPRSLSATDKDSKQRFWGSFTKSHRGGKATSTQTALQVAPAIAVNLRDIGKVSDIIKEGILFRSSELISAQEVQRYDIQTVVDLRRMDRPCKQSVNVHERRIRKLWHDIRMVIPEDKKPYNARGMPNGCTICSMRFSERHEHTCEVMHADFIPGRVGFHIFQAMPSSIRFQAILAALSGKGAASVMAPAVANPAYMGYKVLYRTVLDKSKRGIAKAIRVLRDERNFPVLVHCIHGKDRTGLLVMLILLLCDIPPADIVKDYMLSETVLKESRMHQELQLDTYLTSDDVIAATRDCMEDTITYLNEKCGGIHAYLKTCGLEEWELSQIRVNLLAQAAPKDLMERLRRSSTIKKAIEVNAQTQGGLFSRKSRRPVSELRRRSDPTAAQLKRSGERARQPAQRSSLDGLSSQGSCSREVTTGFSVMSAAPLLSSSGQPVPALLAGRPSKPSAASPQRGAGLSCQPDERPEPTFALGSWGPDPMRAPTPEELAGPLPLPASPLQPAPQQAAAPAGVPFAARSWAPDPMRPNTAAELEQEGPARTSHAPAARPSWHASLPDAGHEAHADDPPSGDTAHEHTSWDHSNGKINGCAPHDHHQAIAAAMPGMPGATQEHHNPDAEKFEGPVSHVSTMTNSPDHVPTAVAGAQTVPSIATASARPLGAPVTAAMATPPHVKGHGQLSPAGDNGAGVKTTGIAGEAHDQQEANLPAVHSYQPTAHASASVAQRSSTQGSHAQAEPNVLDIPANWDVVLPTAQVAADSATAGTVSPHSLPGTLRPGRLLEPHEASVPAVSGT